VGPNGAGKTTAVKLLMNIHRASSGTARVLDADSRKLGPAEFRRIGYVSENQEQPEWMTTGYFFDYWRAFYPRWDRELERALIRQFELPLERKIGQLSRGMRMKAALVSSLAYRPELIVLDEPFSGLDPLVRDELIQGVLDGAGESTIFLSSHDLAEIESFATHVGFVDHGRLSFAEELETLVARFREVTVTCDAEAKPRPGDSRAWLDLETSGAVARFIDPYFDEADTPARIRACFDRVRDISATRMPLRSIFVALARERRQTGVAGA
jgi:ABC-2 type transport system ATP-binding protein